MAAGPATSAVSAEWSARVNEAVRDARIEVIGRADVKNESHAEALVAMLRAYGASSQGFLYGEPHLARKAYRPRDILLCHPAVGVLVIEVKSHALEGIQRVVAGHLIVRTNGFNEDKDGATRAKYVLFMSGVDSEASLFSEARDTIAALYRLDRLS